MGKNTKVITFSLVLGLVLFGYILGNTDIDATIKLLDEAQAIHISMYILFTFLMHFGHTVSWNFILKSQGVKISFVSLINYRMADHAVSFLTPGPKVGGEITRASMMSKKYRISYSKALSSCVLDKLVIAASDGLFLSAGMLVATILIPMPLGWKLFLYTITAFFLGLIVSFYYYISRGKKFFHTLFESFGLYKIKRMKKMEKDVVKFENYLKKFYTEDRKDFIRSHITCLITKALSLFEYYFLLRMLGFEVGIPGLIFISTMIGVAYTAPVFMGFGVLEAGQLSVFSIMRMPTNAGVLVAMSTRVRDLLWAAWGLVAIAYQGLDISDALSSLKNNGYSKK